MPLRHSTTGLGLDFEPPGDGLQSRPYPSDAELLSRAPGQRIQRTLTGPRAPCRPAAKRNSRSEFRPPSAPPVMAESATTESVALRSRKAMEGLESAERGNAMVEFDLGGQSMKEGSRFVLDPMTPRGGTIAHRGLTGSYAAKDDSAPMLPLPRDATLLNLGQSHARNAVELKSLLGDSNARLKSGAAVPPTLEQKTLDKKTRKDQTVALEQAKSRARVELDIILQSNVYVQGGCVRGLIKVRVQRGRKKEAPVQLAGGKVRIVGFETLPNDDERHVFYQYAAPFTSITPNSSILYDSPADEDGFAQAAQGVHALPFSFQLPRDGRSGAAKGALSMTSGISVRYIVMVSIKVRDPNTGKRSLAHFYRNCEVWPHLDPSVILRPAPRPLHASTAKNISLLGGSSATKVKLSAQLTRLHWAAGTRCPVSLHIFNGSKKTIRSVVLTLVRTTTLFRPRAALDLDAPTAGRTVDRDPDACQTATTHKIMAESFLEMGAGAAKGRASAKGWWTGVGPGQEMSFTHGIVLPPEVLSVTRSRLVEVEYSMRVTVSAGSLAQDVSVTLPVRIFNFVSIDPPVDAGMQNGADAFPRGQLLQVGGEGCVLPNATYAGSSRSVVSDAYTGITGSEPDEHAAPGSRFSALHVTNPDLPSAPPSRSCSVEALRAMDSEVSMSMYSTDSASASDRDADGEGEISVSVSHALSGVVELDEDVGSDDELDAVMRSVSLDEGRFTNIESLRRPQSSTDASTSAGQKGVKVRGRFRVEGVGTGMRMTGFGRRLQEERRKRIKGRRGNTQGNATHPRMCIEDEETPRLGCSDSTAVLQYASGSVDGSACDTSYGVDASHERSREQSYEQEQPYALDPSTDGSGLGRRPSRQLPRPPSIPPNGSASATGGAHEGSYHRPTHLSIPASTSISEPTTDAATVSTLLQSLRTQSQSQPAYAQQTRPTYTHAHTRPGHTFRRQPPAFGRTLPGLPDHTRTQPIAGLPIPPPASAYPSDPELLRMEILRPPVLTRNSCGSGSSEGTNSSLSSRSGDGVKGRVAALEERVRAARVSGDVY